MAANGSGSEISSSVRLRGLPWSCKEGEIKKFFTDIGDSIKTIHFTMTREGRPSGEAYVEFATAADASKALEYDNESIGSRYIEVFECKQQEMAFVMRHRDDVDSSEEAILRLRGVPFGIGKEEIAQFFDGLEIVPNGILLPVDMSGRPTGEAFVQFADRAVSERAMEKHMDRIGHRYIEVFRSSQDEVKHAMWKLNGPQQADPYGGGYGDAGYGMNPYAMRGAYGGAGRARATPYSRGGGPMVGYPGYGMPRMPMQPKAVGGFGGSYGGGMGTGGNYAAIGDYASNFPGRGSSGHMVHMRGLPYRAAESDIKEFFSPLQVSNVTMRQDEMGRPSGECDVEFYSHVDAVEAMKKDRENIGSRYVELFLDSTAAGGKSSFGGPMMAGFGGMKMF